MKSLLIAGAAILVSATAASAQFAPWTPSHPYAQRHHHSCQEKAFRLHQYERRAARDGRISHSEREVIRALQHDLNRSCGGFRHRG